MVTRRAREVAERTLGWVSAAACGAQDGRYADRRPRAIDMRNTSTLNTLAVIAAMPRLGAVAGTKTTSRSIDPT